jgi:hypothetical protein
MLFTSEPASPSKAPLLRDLEGEGRSCSLFFLSWDECDEWCFEDEEACGFVEEVARADNGSSSSSSLDNSTLERFEEAADDAGLDVLDAKLAADCAASDFTFDKMDCKSGAAAGVGAEEEAGREAGVAAVDVAVDKVEAAVAEEDTLGEATADAIFAINGLSSSSSFGVLTAAMAGLGDVTLDVLEDKGWSSSSAGGGFTLAALGDAATTGVLGMEEMGTSSSSLGADTLTGANLGEVALRGDVTWSPFMRKEFVSLGQYNSSCQKYCAAPFCRVAGGVWSIPFQWQSDRCSEMGDAAAAATEVTRESMATGGPHREREERENTGLSNYL